MTEYPVDPTKRIRPPTHPGAILREDVLPSLSMSITEAAKRLCVSRQLLHKILNESAGVTPEMALRLGKFLGNGPELWLNMQRRYDLWHAARKVDLKAVRTAA